MKPIEKIVIDANVLLSIVMGGTGAKRVVMHPLAPQLYVTRDAYREVEEYIPVLSAKKGLSEHTLWSIWHTLPVYLVEVQKDTPAWKQAWNCLHARDQDDVPTLALALSNQWPIWSQDNDFDEARELCTVLRTADLLRLLDEAKD